MSSANSPTHPILLPLNQIPPFSNLTIQEPSTDANINKPQYQEFSPLKPTTPINKIQYILLDYFTLMLELSLRDVYYDVFDWRVSASHNGLGSLQYSYHSTLHKNQFLLHQECFILRKKSCRYEMEWIQRFGKELYRWLLKEHRGSGSVAKQASTDTKSLQTSIHKDPPLHHFNIYVSKEFSDFITCMTRGRQFSRLEELCEAWMRLLEGANATTTTASEDAQPDRGIIKEPHSLKSVPSSAAHFERRTRETKTLLHNIKQQSQHLLMDNLIVGRNHELNLMEEFTKASTINEESLNTPFTSCTATDESKLIIVSSTDTGVGKTLLVDTFAQNSSQLLTLSAQCLRNFPLPFSCIDAIIGHFFSLIHNSMDTADIGEFVSTVLHDNPQMHSLLHYQFTLHSDEIDNGKSLIKQFSNPRSNPEPLSMTHHTLHLYNTLLAHISSFVKQKFSKSLCIVLDDIHWADTSSLRLLEHSIGQKSVPLFIVTYTSHHLNNLRIQHQFFSRIMARLRSHSSVLNVKINQMTSTQMNQLICEAVKLSPVDADQLRAKLQQCTTNSLSIFSLCSLLEHASQDLDIIYKDDSLKQWKCHMDRLDELVYYTCTTGRGQETSGSATRMQQIIIGSKLHKLSAECNLLLQYLACISQYACAGVHSVSGLFQLLCTLTEMSEEQVRDHLIPAFKQSLIDIKTLSFLDASIHDVVLQRMDPLFTMKVYERLIKHNLQEIEQKRSSPQTITEDGAIFGSSFPHDSLGHYFTDNHTNFALCNYVLLYLNSAQKIATPKQHALFSYPHLQSILLDTIHASALFSSPELAAEYGEAASIHSAGFSSTMNASNKEEPSDDGAPSDDTVQLQLYLATAYILTVQHEKAHSLLKSLLSKCSKEPKFRLLCWRLLLVNSNREENYERSFSLLTQFLSSNQHLVSNMPSDDAESISEWTSEFWKDYQFDVHYMDQPSEDASLAQVELLGCIVEGCFCFFSEIESSDPSQMANIFFALTSLAGKLAMECSCAYTPVALNLFCIPLICIRNDFENVRLIQERIDNLNYMDDMQTPATPNLETGKYSIMPHHALNILALLLPPVESINSYFSAYFPLHLTCTQQMNRFREAYSAAEKVDDPLWMRLSSICFADVEALYGLNFWTGNKKLGITTASYQNDNLRFHSERLVQVLSGKYDGHKGSLVLFEEYPVRLHHNFDSIPVFRFHRHLYTAVYLFYMEEYALSMESMNQAQQFLSDVLGTMWWFIFLTWRLIILSQFAHEYHLHTVEEQTRVVRQLEKLKGSISSSFDSYFDAATALIEADLMVLSLPREAHYSGLNMKQIIQHYQNAIQLCNDSCPIIGGIAAERLAMYMKTCKVGAIFERAAAMEAVELYSKLNIHIKSKSIQERFGLRLENLASTVDQSVKQVKKHTSVGVQTNTRKATQQKSMIVSRPRKERYSARWDPVANRYVFAPAKEEITAKSDAASVQEEETSSPQENAGDNPSSARKEQQEEARVQTHHDDSPGEEELLQDALSILAR